MLGLIPARGGSKGIPRKNARLLAGRPLLDYTAEAALKARRLSRVILSTEDPEIAEIGRRCGLDVPFLRPPELARDDTPTLPVVQHALRWLEERGERFSAVCLLQPTSPLRTAEHIDACIELLEKDGADAVVTVLRVPPEHNPHWVFVRDGDGFLRLATGSRRPFLAVRICRRPTAGRDRCTSRGATSFSSRAACTATASRVSPSTARAPSIWMRWKTGPGRRP